MRVWPLNFLRKGVHWVIEKPIGAVEKTRVGSLLDSEDPGITQTEGLALFFKHPPEAGFV